MWLDTGRHNVTDFLCAARRRIVSLSPAPREPAHHLSTYDLRPEEDPLLLAGSEAIRQLPPAQREMATLFRRGVRPFEIAARRRTSKATVTIALRRVRARLLGGIARSAAVTWLPSGRMAHGGSQPCRHATGEGG